MYYCERCRREVEIDYKYPGIRCQYCGHKILIKKRPSIIKRVKAR
jgi:DNA-directed RNA polymerase subunit P